MVDTIPVAIQCLDNAGRFLSAASGWQPTKVLTPNEGRPGSRPRRRVSQQTEGLAWPWVVSQGLLAQHKRPKAVSVPCFRPLGTKAGSDDYLQGPTKVIEAMDDNDQTTWPKLGQDEIVSVPVSPRQRRLVALKPTVSLTPVLIGAMALLTVGVILALRRLSERRKEVVTSRDWLWRRLSAATRPEWDAIADLLTHRPRILRR